MFWKLFMYAPLAVFVITFFTFVRRARLSWKAQLAWSVWLLFCFSKFCVFKWFGGHAFNPNFNQYLLWFWDWAYSGAVFLAILALLCLFRFPRKATILAVVAWGISAIGLWNGVHVPAVHSFELVFDDLPPALDGYRILQITDMHCSGGARRWRTEAIVDRANALNADLICLTGDYVDGYVQSRLSDIEPIKRLRARDGILAITGNHEYYWRYLDWKTNFYDKVTNIRFLTNECIVPHEGLVVGGVPDPAGAKRRRGIGVQDAMPDVAKAFAAAPKDAFRLLMQHQPKWAMENTRELGVRLQLSGHTHGGITPPFRPIIARKNGGFVCGLYTFGNSYLYVSPGSGQWEGFPMRFFNDSEISLITLRKGKSD